MTEQPEAARNSQDKPKMGQMPPDVISESAVAHFRQELEVAHANLTPGVDRSHSKIKSTTLFTPPSGDGTIKNSRGTARKYEATRT